MSDEKRKTLSTVLRLNREQVVTLVVLSVAFVGVVIAMRFYYPVGVDWRETFHPAVSQNWRDPFLTPTFTNPPWLMALLPHAWLGLEWGNAVNMALTFMVLGAVIWRYKGGWQALLLTFTSPVFFDLARTNNIDWVAALAFLLPPMWGLPLLAIKPQTLGGAALIWWKRQRFSPLMLLPLVIITGLSFAIWGLWPLRVNGLPEAARFWNFAPWPFAVPLGIYILYQAYKAEDAILGAAASPFLVPYFAPYSLAPLLALLACKHRRVATFVYFGFWFFFIVETRRSRLGF